MMEPASSRLLKLELQHGIMALKRACLLAPPELTKDVERLLQEAQAVLLLVTKNG